jgi:hypothetical protein
MVVTNEEWVRVRCQKFKWLELGPVCLVLSSNLPGERSFRHQGVALIQIVFLCQANRSLLH